MRFRAPKVTLQQMPVYLLLMGLILFGTRTYEEAQGGLLAVGGLHRIIGIGGALALSFLLMTLSRRAVVIPAALRAYAAYCFVGLLSTLLFSDFLLYSTWKLTEIIATLAVAMHVATSAKSNAYAANHFYETTLHFIRLLMFAALLGAIAFPDIAWQPALTESSLRVYGTPILPMQLHGTIFVVNPNSLGVMAASLLIVHGIRLRNRVGSFKYNFLLSVIALFTLVVSQSRTAVLGLFAALFAILFLTEALGRRARILVPALGVGATLLVGPLLWSYLTRGVSIEHLQNLTGRSTWWTIAFEHFAQADLINQFLGMGFVTANRSILTSELGATVTTLHSDWMDATISSGLAGLVLLLLFLILAWKVALGRRMRSQNSVLQGEVVGLLALLTVRTITGTTFAIFNHFLVLGISSVVAAWAVQRYSASRIHAPGSLPFHQSRAIGENC